MNSRSKGLGRRIFWIFAKLLVAGAIIAWLSMKLDFSRVWEVVIDAQPAPIMAGIALGLCTVAIAGWRWHRLLTVFCIHAPLASLICITQIGQFFAMFLPGPIGDDLTRMLYISRLAKGRAGEACTTVLIDRVIGLAAVLGLALGCIPWQWQLIAASDQTRLLALGILAAGIGAWTFGAFFFLAAHPTHAWFAHCLRYVSARNIRDEAARIWGLLCTHKRIVAAVICGALLTQMLLCTLFSLAGLAVGIHVPLLAWMSFIPIVLASNAIPITVAGIGVREYLLVLFLGVIANVDGERALAASLVALSMIVAVSLFGGLVYTLYRPRHDAPEQGSEPKDGVTQ